MIIEAGDEGDERSRVVAPEGSVPATAGDITGDEGGQEFSVILVDSGEGFADNRIYMASSRPTTDHFFYKVGSDPWTPVEYVLNNAANDPIDLGPNIGPGSGFAGVVGLSRQLEEMTDPISDTIRELRIKVIPRIQGPPVSPLTAAMIRQPPLPPRPQTTLH